ncbi:sugar ABC transporter ATP-binding protein, partial [Arthrospira platensis SPKY1]|nr:sugar ABC transporter ATP-binding protein [Arthrospira platensis SPKY1]
TTVHVTHDQREAMQLGQRIIVLCDGRVQQIGTPLEIYDRPANRFVGEFMGSPRMNFFAGRLISRSGTLWLEAGELSLRWPGTLRGSSGAEGERQVVLGIRPEHFRIGAAPIEAAVSR